MPQRKVTHFSNCKSRTSQLERDFTQFSVLLIEHLKCVELLLYSLGESSFHIVP